MWNANLVVLVLVACRAAVAAPAASQMLVPSQSPAAELAAAETTSKGPDCAAIEEYCKCKNDDLQCEENVDCQWCRDHHAWDKLPTVIK
ncbi:hypothetical protein F4818DRAFT_444743 [Hypoxylon cercidicola]|nr:hypothetical protein F4818DRAFT_444743 [Hypoxylon cercidicola]